MHKLKLPGLCLVFEFHYHFLFLVKLIQVDISSIFVEFVWIGCINFQLNTLKNKRVKPCKTNIAKECSPSFSSADVIVYRSLFQGLASLSMDLSSDDGEHVKE